MGWLIAGPTGSVILNFIAINILKFSTAIKSPKARVKSLLGDNAIALVQLSAIIMTADKKINKSEYTYVKSYLFNEFGDQPGKIAYEYLKVAVKEKINIYYACKQVKKDISYHARRKLIMHLFNVAKSGELINNKEIECIDLISKNIEIKPAEFEEIKRIYLREQQSNYKFSWSNDSRLNEAYSVLGVNSSSSIEDIKHAYKSLAKRHHPDIVSFLGEEKRISAKEKFQQIVKAYDTIKHHRDFN